MLVYLRKGCGEFVGKTRLASIVTTPWKQDGPSHTIRFHVKTDVTTHPTRVGKVGCLHMEAFGEGRSKMPRESQERRRLGSLLWWRHGPTWVSLCGSNFLPALKWNYPGFSISLLRCGAEERDGGGLKVVRIKHSILVNGVRLFTASQVGPISIYPI